MNQKNLMNKLKTKRRKKSLNAKPKSYRYKI